MPAGLRGEERHEQIARVGQPGAVVVDGHLDDPVMALPADPHAAAGLERRIGGVAHEVDEQLVELIAVARSAPGPGPRPPAPSSRRSSAATRRTHSPTCTGRSCGCGSRASRAYAPMKRASDSDRASITSSPRRRSCSQSGGRAGRSARLRRLPAIDLIGASELLISWPSTRTIRCHAERSSARSTRLRSESTSSRCGRPSWRKILPRSSHRPVPPGNAASIVRGRLAVETGREAQRVGAEPEQPLGRTGRGAARRPGSPAGGAGPPSNAKMATSISSITRRSSAVASSARRRCERRVSLSVLISSRARLRPSSARAPRRADRVVALAQRGEQVGDRLQRPEHPLAHERRPDEPGADHDERERDLGAERVRAGPEQPARDQHGGQPGEQRRDEDPRLVTGGPTPPVRGHDAAAGGRARSGSAPGPWPRG